MSQSFDIAVIGATGTVGETLVQLLEERDFPLANLHLLASVESAGQSLPFKGKNLRVRALDAFDFSTVRLAFFAAGEQISTQLCRQGASRRLQPDRSKWRSDRRSRRLRVVPEANGDVPCKTLVAPYQLACPSPSVAALACVLAPLRALAADAAHQPGRLPVGVQSGS